MRVCIIGGGKVGYYLSKTLMEHGHDPIIIEINEHACSRLADNLDLPVIHGDGTLVEILELARAGGCGALVGVTGRDETNLIACQLAKKVFGIKRRSPESTIRKTPRCSRCSVSTSRSAAPTALPG